MSIKGRIKAFRAMSTVRKVIYSVGTVAAVVALVLLVGYVREQPTRTFLALPEGTIELGNMGEQTLPFAVRVVNTPAARREGVRKVRPEVVAEKPVLYVYRVNTSARHVLTDVRLPLDVGFFDEDGAIVAVFQGVQPGETVVPGERYRYLLKARAGHFAENTIGAEFETALFPDTLSIAVASR